MREDDRGDAHGHGDEQRAIEDDADELAEARLHGVRRDHRARLAAARAECRLAPPGRAAARAALPPAPAAAARRPPEAARADERERQHEALGEAARRRARKARRRGGGTGSDR